MKLEYDPGIVRAAEHERALPRDVLGALQADQVENNIKVGAIKPIGPLIGFNREAASVAISHGLMMMEEKVDDAAVSERMAGVFVTVLTSYLRQLNEPGMERPELPQL